MLVDLAAGWALIAVGPVAASVTAVSASPAFREPNHELEYIQHAITSLLVYSALTIYNDNAQKFDCIRRRV